MFVIVGQGQGWSPTIRGSAGREVHVSMAEAEATALMYKKTYTDTDYWILGVVARVEAVPATYQVVPVKS